MLILEYNSCINNVCNHQALGLAQQPPPRDCEGEGHRGSEGPQWEEEFRCGYDFTNISMFASHS